ncbi:MAG: DNA repair protein RecN [Bacteroidaceae bacterium]|nr:DNA repair protein RecN [Bacteroidaceae bacterium]
MITNLHIENYALIEHLDIDLHPGFSVITGETGAGKSIILGAIGLLLGARADSKSIKAGANRCIVEATFDVSRYGLDAFFRDNDLDFDGTECIIRRELTSSGKSRAFINDTPASLSQLKELGDSLIDVHSQHKNLLLAKEDFQLSVLDTVAHNADNLSVYNKEYLLYRDLLHQLQAAKDAAESSRQDEEFIRFQVGELADAKLQADEQQLLEDEAEMLSHAEDIKSGLYSSFGALSADDDRGSDALQLVKESLRAIQGISNVWPKAEEFINRLDSCYIELKDIASEIESAAEEVEYNPSRLEYVNNRLNTIYDLQKKHSVDSIQELLDIQAQLEHKLLLLDNSDELIEELSRKCEQQYDKVYGLAEELSTARRAAADRVCQEMVNRLIPLGMPNVQFEVQFTEQSLSPKGIDHVAFLFSANKNTPLKDVSQVASGGEIARVMLSLKALIAGTVHLPTIIFDEIDTGVSGSIAEKMARTMKEMGVSDRQVISITHLPQIAALGTSHYRVYKEDNADSTVSHIIALTPEQRIEEIAHMLSGETLTDAAIENARSLLSNS